MDARALVAAYLRQQKELGMPDPVFGNAGKIRSIAAPDKSLRRTDVHAASCISPPAGKHERPPRPYERLRKLPPPLSAVQEPAPAWGGTAPSDKSGILTYDEKRAVFTAMYVARCEKCALAKTRRRFVFGGGNVGAQLMIVGEAPGAEEDEQGLPFVGAAGRVLTELCEGVAIDRKKDVFITNVLKCRPPDNRTPDASEVVACLPLLQKQIEVMSPRLLLLLGRVAAHALLGTADGVGKLRGREHEYRGIPALVTYHPAALLRTSEYRGPAEEDFRRVADFLKGKR
ncbi:MAG: uracil-DNA glycosylase [Chitinispirillaceae bacterium]|nr:uracil-DNA glycosylase [Chitinispirillaceae bacterium]